MLRFDYELIDGEVIQSIRGWGREIMNDGSVSYEELRVGVGQSEIKIQVNVDTDELEVSLANREAPETGSAKFADVPEMADCVGRELRWSWEARNYRGYWDILCFSVSGIDPDFCLVGKASTIALHRVSKIVAVK